MYAERAYFDGDHCQHCADRDEHHRLARKQREALRVIRDTRRSRARTL